MDPSSSLDDAHMNAILKDGIRDDNETRLTISMPESYRRYLDQLLSVAPIPEASGAGWYLRILIDLIPMPDVPLVRESVINETSQETLKGLAEATNKVAKYTNSNGTVPASLLESFLLWEQIINGIVTEIRLRLPQTNPHDNGKQISIPTPPLPWPIDAKFEEVLPQQDPIVRVGIRCSRSWRSEARAKGRAYGGGSKGRLSHIVRCMISQKKLPDIPRPKAAKSDAKAINFCGLIAGHCTQIVRKTVIGKSITLEEFFHVKALQSLILTVGHTLRGNGDLLSEDTFEGHLSQVEKEEQERQDSLKHLALKRAGLL